MKFTDLISNEKIKERLTSLYCSDRFPHALILEGETGLGKHTLAREIALNLMCRNGDERPCRSCPQCSKVLKGVHPDLYEYTAPDRAAAFHVDVVRNVIKDAYMSPNESDYKVFILGNCQSMNASAQNALLKILEEPPAYVIFILLVTNKSFLLETVLSRSVVLTLEGADIQSAAEYICEKDDSIRYSDAFAAAQLWGGNIGKALESLSDGKLSEIGSIADRVAKAVVSENEYDLLKACSVFERDRETMISALVLLKTVFRDALVYDGNDLISGNRETAGMLSSRLSKEKIIRLIGVCDQIKKLAERNGNQAVLMTKLCYDLRTAQGR